MKLELLPIDAPHQPIKSHAKTNSIVPNVQWATATVALAQRNLATNRKEQDHAE